MNGTNFSCCQYCFDENMKMPMVTWHQALKKDETKNAPNEADLLTPRLLQLHPAGEPKLAVVLHIAAKAAGAEPAGQMRDEK
jgi:hypothetical protein